MEVPGETKAFKAAYPLSIPNLITDIQLASGKQ